MSSENERGESVEGTRPRPGLRAPDRSLTPALRQALNVSITSGRFSDTKIYLFSHRSSAGNICKPKALYANSIVLKSVPYFDDLFSGNYSESATKDLNEDVAEEDAIAEHYDYYSDSDLEDEEDLQRAGNSKESDTAADGSRDALRDDKICAYYEESMREGRIIRVQDVAFVTFQAFLLYLYTGRIEFTPFERKEDRKTRTAEIVALAPDRVPRPSAKSIYRLADKYDVPTLKSLALNKIKAGLERCDPIQETFSRFAADHPEILRIHVENLAGILTGTDSGKVQNRLHERLHAFGKGEIHHASEAFSSLWKILTKSESCKTPRDTHRDIPFGLPPPTESSQLTIALIMSIRQGSFCNRRYLAKRGNKEGSYSPIYISSAVTGGVERSLSTLAVNPELGVHDSDNDSDSDCEDTTEGTYYVSEDPGSLVGDGYKPTKAAPLSAGVFLTWRALFFYLYTGQAHFAPLKSSGPEARAKYVEENRALGNQPSCSPKSACYLAGKLGLLRLENAALGDVAAKTSVMNIVEEAFSKSTARLPRLRETQCQLLLSSSKNERVAKATDKYIHSLADGQVSHRSAALSLGFRMAIGAKRVVPATEAPLYSPYSSIQDPLDLKGSDRPSGGKGIPRKQRAGVTYPVGGGPTTQISTTRTVSTTELVSPGWITRVCPNSYCRKENRQSSHPRGIQWRPSICDDCGTVLW